MRHPCANHTERRDNAWEGGGPTGGRALQPEHSAETGRKQTPPKAGALRRSSSNDGCYKQQQHDLAIMTNCNPHMCHSLHAQIVQFMTTSSHCPHQRPSLNSASLPKLSLPKQGSSHGSLSLGAASDYRTQQRRDLALHFRFLPTNSKPKNRRN